MAANPFTELIRTMEKLFCYGTLQEPRIVKAIIGKTPKAFKATLSNYICLSVNGAAYPGIKKSPGANTTGLVYSDISTQDLKQLDHYEGPEYKRVQLSVRYSTEQENDINESVWAYVYKPEYFHRLSQSQWQYELFLQQHLKFYLKRLR